MSGPFVAIGLRAAVEAVAGALPRYGDPEIVLEIGPDGPRACAGSDDVYRTCTFVIHQGALPPPPPDWRVRVPAAALRRVLAQVHESHDALLIERSSDTTLVLSWRSCRVALSTSGKPPEPMALAARPFDFTMSSPMLMAALRAVRHAIGTEETHYALQGVRVEPTPAGVRFAATDGHRMAIVEDSQPMPADLPAFTIPVAAVDNLLRMLPFNDEPVRIAVDPERNLAEFRLDADGALTACLVPADYPDIDRVMPERHPAAIHINRSELLRGLAALGAASRERRPGFTLATEGGEVRMSLADYDSSASVVFTLEAARASGPDEMARFYVHQMVDAAQASPPKRPIVIRLHRTSPAIVEPAGGGVRFLLMPIRI